MLLSVIVPMSLLLTFRLTGILHEPLQLSETITLDTVGWQAERPDALIAIRHSLYGFYDKEIKLVQKVYVDGFHPSPLEHWGSNCIFLNFNANASISSGYIYSINLTAREKNYANAVITFFEPNAYIIPENLTKENLKNQNQTVFVYLLGTNHPKGVSLFASIDWVLNSPCYKAHALEITSEVTYFNGTVYKKVVQSFLLEVGPDSNDSLQSAMEIHAGNYTWLYLSELNEYDTVDWYKIYAGQGQRVKIFTHRASSPSPKFNVSVYDSDKNLALSDAVDAEKTSEHTIDFISNSTGFWYIKLQIVYNFGFYNMEVS